ncbi:MAG TPA: DUF3857 domain-containing protein [candidate division Zixibacteria bacterium]|nr:DUF3857 domain-containing protein [candidate division Zixibacteria bacterium]
MKTNKLILIVLIAAVIAGSIFAKHRDIIYMRDGSEHIGELVRISEEVLVFDSPDGRIELDPADVRSIDLGTWRPGDDWRTRFDIDDKILEEALETADEVSRKFTDAGHIALYEKAELILHEDGTAEFIERYIYYVANESGKSVANWSTTYFEDVHEVEVEFARSVGISRISTVADNAIEDGSTNPYLADYQRQRAKKFAITGVSLGSVVDYRVSKKFNQIDMFNGLNLTWQFYDTEPIIESIFELAEKGNSRVEIREFKAPKAKKSKRDGYSVRTWRMTDIEPYLQESMLPNPDLVLPNIAVTIPADLSKLSAEYARKVEEAFDARDEVRSRLAERFPDGNPSLEQVYNFVAENFMTNWVGMNSYYPYPKPLSQLLISSRMARHELVFVLYCFLVEAGISADLVLIGPSLDYPLPIKMLNIEHFRDIRVRVQDGETNRYLYPDEYLRYDKQLQAGVVVLPVAKTGARPEELPRLPGNFAYQIPRFDCVLHPDGALDVTYTVQSVGPTGQEHFRYRKNDKPRELDNHFESLAKRIDDMATLVDYTLTGFKSLEEEVEVSYRVHIPGFAVGAGEEILAFKLPTVDFGAGQVAPATRRLPFALRGNSFGEKIINIELPDGYEIEHLPASANFSTKFTEFRGEITLEGNSIVYRQTTSQTHSPLISTREYPKFKEFIESRARFSDNWILIRKI